MFQLIAKSKIANIDTFPVNFNITSTGSLFKALKGKGDKPLQKQTVGFITYQNFFHDSVFSLEVYQDIRIPYLVLVRVLSGKQNQQDICIQTDRQRYINKTTKHIYTHTHTHTHTYMGIGALLCMKATWNNKIVLFNSILKCQKQYEFSRS